MIVRSAFAALLALAGASLLTAPEAGAEHRRWRFEPYFFEPSWEPPPPRRRYTLHRYDRYDDFEDEEFVPRRRKLYREAPEFYEPEYVPPKRKRKKVALPIAKTPVEKPKAKVKAKAISCAKAEAMVGEYGFGDVKSTNCKGQIYTFAATRDGQAFAISMNSISGELTKVKKQVPPAKREASRAP